MICSDLHKEIVQKILGGLVLNTGIAQKVGNPYLWSAYNGSERLDLFLILLPIIYCHCVPAKVETGNITRVQTDSQNHKKS